MKKAMKSTCSRVVSWMLVLTMLLCGAPIQVQAAAEQNFEGYEATEEESEGLLSGTADSENTAENTDQDQWQGDESGLLQGQQDAEAYNESIPEVTAEGPVMEITDDHLNFNQYETYYYTDGITYTYNGKPVTFVSGEEIETDGQRYTLKNQKTDVTVTKNEDGTVSVGLSDLKIPVGSISGSWNSSYGGVREIVYQSDIPGMQEIRSAKWGNPIVLIGIPDGTYHLSSGTIYEAANEWSPGYDFGDGKGTVTSRFFGTLPDIEITIGGSSGGDVSGTIQVGSADQLPESIAADITCELTADITLGAGQTISSITGVLDGKGHVITLTDSPLANEISGTVQNLGVISSDKISSTADFGSIASTLSGTIQNCYSRAGIAEADGQNVGGLVGILDGGTIKNSYYFKYNDNIGGLAGISTENGGSLIHSSYIYSAKKAVLDESAGEVSKNDVNSRNSVTIYNPTLNSLNSERPVTGFMWILDSEVNDGYPSLTEESIDKTALNTAVSEAETRHEEDYTTDSWSEFQTALEEAKKIADDDAVTQEQIEEALTNLNKAVENLEEKPDEPEDQDGYWGIKTEAKVYDDFENDIWLQYQQKEMNVGDTADLYPWRMEQIITNPITNDVFRPDFHFEIIAGDSISLDTTQSNEKATVTAVKQGTSVVQVTYDAVDYSNLHWDAISDVNTGYAVFTVGEDGAADICCSELENWRHYDTIYYNEGQTTPFTFHVETENAVSTEVTLNGTVIEGEDGTYTAQLENRSNIIGVKAVDADGKVKSMYRVVDARFIRINVENKTNPGKVIRIGDTANISFEGITMPVYKLATIYNPCYNFSLFGENTKSARVLYENEKLGKFEGVCKQWDLAENNDFDVKFSEAGTYTFESPQGIYCEWWGEVLGTDAEVQGQGNPNMSASVRTDYFSTLPSFTVKVEEKGYLGVRTEVKVYDDFTNDIWLQYQQKDMKVGDTASLYPWRLEQIITDTINNDVTRPDFHFKIISGDSISLNTETSDQKAVVTAEKPGTSVVQVTYDAKDYKGMHWGAVSPVNIGYAVFTVGEQDSKAEISCEELKDWRHYDTIYYNEGNTVPFTFHVDTSNAESVTVTLNGQDIEGQDGEYTAQLENRSNIIGIEAADADGKIKSMYRIVDARFIEIHVDNKMRPGKDLIEGDAADISFKGITMPVYKLATIYNPCNTFSMFGENTKSARVLYENEELGKFEGACRQWDLAEKNTFTVTFQKAGTYKFDSPKGIYAMWWGDALGADTSKEGQGDPNLGAATTEEYFSIMPSFSVEVEEREEEVKLEGISFDKKNLELEVNEAQQLSVIVNPENAECPEIIWNSENENVATVENGLVTAKAKGETVIKAQAGDFTAECTVTVMERKPAGTVTVTIKDEQPIPEGEDWMQPKGTIVDSMKVAIYDEDSMMDAIVRACEENGISIRLNSSKTYIAEIDGLAEFDKGYGSGWMGTLNDWITNKGFADFKVKDNTFCDGDVIVIEYTLSYGSDLTDTKDNTGELKTLGITPGTLTPKYERTVEAYTLAVPEDTTEITVTPESYNRFNMVTIKADGKEYRRGAAIPVSAGTKIEVTSKALGFSGGNGAVKTYTVTVKDMTKRAELEALVKEAKEIKEESCTENGYKTLQDAIRKAEEVLGQEDASDTELSDQITALKKVLDKLEADGKLDKVKADAVKSLNSYKNPEDYREVQKEELKKAVADGEKAILAADSEEAVEKALASAKAALDKIKTDSQLQQEEDKDTADAVEKKITAIGEVTLLSENAIKEARKAYDALTDDQKELVKNYQILADAEKKLKELKDEKPDPEPTPDPDPTPNPGTTTLVHEKYGISLEGEGFDSDMELSVTPLGKDDSDVTLMRKEITSDKSIFRLYDIKVMKDGKVIPLQKKAILSIPVGEKYNGKELEVLHCKDSKVEHLKGKVSNGILQVEVSSLSSFGVVIDTPKSTGSGSGSGTGVSGSGSGSGSGAAGNGTGGKSSGAKTGDDAPTALLVMMLAASAAGIGILSFKKRKERV